MTNPLFNFASSAKVHRFSDSLQKNKRDSALPIWDEMYRQLFPGFIKSTLCDQPGAHQSQGVDRIVVFHNGVRTQTVKIEEKGRWTCLRRWEESPFSFDVLLEFFSSVEQQTPGWIEKSLDCDYLFYLNFVLGEGVLLPWVQLRQAWQNNRERWIKTCKIVDSKNNGYTTRSVAVPLHTLMAAIGGNLRVRSDLKYGEN